jgi:transposase
MSLKSPNPLEIPAETVRIAKAAFPKGNFCIRLRDEMGTVYQDEQFATLFSKEGQPALAPWRLVLVSILQFVEGLSDRQAAQMVRGRLDWKYLLGLELADSGFDYSVLSEFRARLLEHNPEQLLLDQLLTQLQERNLLKAHGKQRTDATQVLGRVRLLNRLEMVGETIRAALNAVAIAAPQWLVSQIPPEWFDLYGRRIEDYRLPDKDSEREEWALEAGQAGYSLWYGLGQSEEWEWLKNLPALQTLRQIWLQQFYLEEGAVKWRPPGSIPPPALRLHSPYAPQVRYASKREIHWLGYKVHLSETCEADSPRLITQVHTSFATVPDVKATEPIQQSLIARHLAPAQHFVDGGYVSGDVAIASQLERGIELCGPLRVDASWQGLAGQGFAVADFQLDWDKQVAVCPKGHKSAKWESKTTGQGVAWVQVSFDRSVCQACEGQAFCTKQKQSGRLLQLRPREQHQVLEQARIKQAQSDYQVLLNQRAGIEATLSQAVRAFELRRTRYFGLDKTHLQHLLTAVGLNLWEGRSPITKRLSPLAKLKPAA